MTDGTRCEILESVLRFLFNVITIVPHGQTIN